MGVRIPLPVPVEPGAKHWPGTDQLETAPDLDRELRDGIVAAAMRFAGAIGFRSVGTVEFLVDVSGRDGAPPFVFIEANARLQVEPTVTGPAMGFNLVQAQIQLAEGDSLTGRGRAALGPVAPTRARGVR